MWKLHSQVVVAHMLTLGIPIAGKTGEKNLANICHDEDMLKMSWSLLEDVFSITFFLSSKASSRRLATRLEDVFGRHIANTSWRRLGRQKIVTLKTSWKTRNVCWERTETFVIKWCKFSFYVMVDREIFTHQ